MVSRRSTRLHGRVQKSLSGKHSRKPTGVSKITRKKAKRIQQKSNILSEARTAREARESHPPLLIGVLSVCGAPDSVIRKFCSSFEASKPEKSPAFNLTFLRRDEKTSRELLISALDIAKVADIIILVFSARSDMDPASADILNAMRAQGMPSVYPVSIGDGAADPILRKLRGRQLAAESLGDDNTLRPIPHSLDDNVEAVAQNRTSLRRIFAKPPRRVNWRSRYGYMSIENAAVHETNARLTICGWVRGRGFSANELVHITGFGSFVVSKIVDCNTNTLLSERNQVQGESPESLAQVDETMDEQTWPPEVDEKAQKSGLGVESAPNREDSMLHTPHTESSTIDHGSFSADDEEEDTLSEINDSKMLIDEAEVKRIRQAAKTDAVFPDEVDTPIDQPARARFARYRGLKSFRTGAWDPKEQLPKTYRSMFQFQDLPATRKRVLNSAKRDSNVTLNGSECPNFAHSGKKVFIELLNVSEATHMSILSILKIGQTPLIASGMLRHENRRSVVHFGMQRTDSEEGPEVKAKTPLEIQVGFVRFEGRPMFSENNTNSDKHKMERFLRHGRHTVVSFYGPAIYAPAPAILCHLNGPMIATGTSLGAAPDRIILKRIILTGYPFKTQKRRSVVRFMFFNPDDIRWFKPVELWTKLGRSGHILEPVGTHGHMKCIFDNVIMHHDTVCMTLYKRVYPKLIDDA